MRRRMAVQNPVYDLVLLLQSDIDDDRRTKVLGDIETLIDKHGGDIVGHHDWGVRPTAYEIRKKADAEYHLIQFHATNPLLEALDHTLKITDGVQRHRVIKLRAGTPDPPDLRPSAVAATVEVAEPDDE